MNSFNLATWFVRITSISKAGGEPVNLTYKIVVVDAHSDVEAELIAARIVFAGPETMANVAEYSSLVSFGIYNKMLLAAKEEYLDWIGQFEHNKNGYYERRPKAQRAKDKKAQGK